MWKAFSGRSESGSTSGLRRKKSGSGRASASDAGVSSTSRRDEDGRRGHKSSRSAYGDDDGKSSASTYATAPTSRVGSSGGRGLTESAVRALESQDEGWEDDDRAKSEKLSRRSEGGERRHKSGRGERERSDSREKKERRRESTSHRDGGRSERPHGKSRSGDDGGEGALPAMGSFAQFPGQYSADLVGPAQTFGPVMSGALPSSDAMHQFPSQIPATFERPQMGPTRADSYGHASEYYMDEGQSVLNQPGHRASTPNMLVNPDLHLMAASAVPQPAEDTGHGSAADFYSGKVSPSPPTTIGASQRPSLGRQSSSSASRPSKLGVLASTAAASAAAAGVLGMASSSRKDEQRTSSTSSYQQTDAGSRPQAQSSRRSPVPSSIAGGAAGSYYAPAPQQIPLSQQGTPAGAAAAGAAAYGISEHHQASTQMNSTSYYGGGGGQGPPRLPYRPGDGSYANGGGMQQHQHFHEHKGPITRLKDGFLNLLADPEDVRRMEEYTEYIGVCKYCFDPRTTPNDGPRRHHFHRRPSQDSFEELRRRKSYERMQRNASSEDVRRRVDKESRYYSSQNDKRRSGGKADVVGVGLAAAGVAAGANMLFNDRKDFDDTYSVKSGHRAGSAMRRRSRSSSNERRRRSQHGVIRADSRESYAKVRTEHGTSITQNVRSASHERRNGLMGVAAGAAIGATAASALAGESRRRHDSQPQGAFVRHHSRSRSRSHSPGLGEIFGFSAGRPSRNGRYSPNGSHHESVRRDRRSSGEQTGVLGGFFSPSQNERKPRRHSREHRKKQKGFFAFGNGSSSSSDDDMAFGEGTSGNTGVPLRRKPSRKAVRKHSNDHLAATVAGIGITAAALAAAQKGHKVSKRTSRPEPGARRDVRVQHDSQYGHTQAEEDEWEDELPSDIDDASSTYSALAFGEGLRLSHRQSFESVSSGDGLSAWGWRWGGKDRKKKQNDSFQAVEPYPSRPVGATSDGVAAGLAAGAYAAAAHDRTDRPLQRDDSASSLPPQPMQYIDPRPVSETGSRHGSMPGSFDSPVGRPGPAPLQQPQPIAPISPAFVQDAFLEDRPKPRRTASSPTRSSFGLQDAALIGVGALAAGSIIAGQGRKGKESSNVRFGLTDEQQRKEDGQRRRERQEADEERRRADRTRALKEEAERHAKEEDSRRREEEVRRRREDENRLAAEATLERQRAVQREAEQQAELDRARRERETRDQQEVYEREQRRLADEAGQQEQSRRQWEAQAAEEAAREKQVRLQREARLQEEIEAKQRQLDEQALRRRQAEEAQAARQRRDEEEAAERRRVDEMQREQRRSKKDSSQESSSAWGPLAADAVAAATVGAVLAGSEHGRSREGKSEKAREHDAFPEKQALHHPISDDMPIPYAAKQILPDDVHSGSPIMDDDLFDKDFFKRKHSESDYARHADLARKAADKVVADRDAYYKQPAVSQADFFAPKDILSQPSAGKTRVASPYDDNDVHVYSAAEDTPRSHSTFGHGTKMVSYAVPSLNVICPTPPPSTPVSARDYETRQQPELVREHDAETAAVERPSKRDRSRSITWGEDKTHIYDPPTPESYQERDSYMYAREAPTHDAAVARAALDEIVVEAATPGANTKRTAYKAEELPLRYDIQPEPSPSYRKPFYESMSDLGFGPVGVDSPGTEGAPPVRGFVEGETDEPTPAEEITAHMPGAFEDDDTSSKYEVIAPSQKLASDQQIDAADSRGIEPEQEEWQPLPSKKDKKKRDKAAKKAPTFDSEPNEFPTPSYEDIQLPMYNTADTSQEVLSESTSKKDKKKRDKNLKRSTTFDSEVSEPSTPVVDDVQLPVLDTPETLRDEPAEYSVSKKDKKKRDKNSKRDSSFPDEPSEAPTPLPSYEPPETPQEEPMDYPVSKKDKKKRDKSKRSSTFDDEPSEPSTPAPVDRELQPDEAPQTPQEEPDDYFLSQKDKKKRDKSKRSSTFDDEPSEPSTPAPVGRELQPDEAPQTPQEEPDDNFLSKKDKKKREKALKHGTSENTSPSLSETERFDVEDTPSTEVTASEPDAPKLSKKEQKKREKEPGFGEYAGLATTAAAVGGIAALAASASPEPEPDWLPPTKKGKKGKKAKESERDPQVIEPPAEDEAASAMPGTWGAETPTELPDPFQYQIKDVEPTPAQEADPLADYSTGKSKKKKKKRESGRFNEPVASSPLRSEWNYDDYMGSQPESQGSDTRAAELDSTAEPASYTNGNTHQQDERPSRFEATAATNGHAAEQAAHGAVEHRREYEDDDRQYPDATAVTASMAAGDETSRVDRAGRGPEYEDDGRRVTDSARYHSPEDDHSHSVASEPTVDRDSRPKSSNGKARSEIGFAVGADEQDTRSVAASEPMDYYNGPRKTKSRSKHDDDDAESVTSTSSRARREKDSSSGKKEKKSGLFGLFSRKSEEAVPLSRQSTHSDEAALSRTSTRNGDEEDGERKHRRKKHREGSVNADDDDDTRSVTSESKHRHRRDRDEKENIENDQRRSSRHDGDDGDSRSESGHRRRHRSERDDDTLSQAGFEGSHKHHHHRRRTGEDTNDSKDRSFLGERVEDLPPLPPSRPESPVTAAANVEQDHGTPALAVPDAHPLAEASRDVSEVLQPDQVREIVQPGNDDWSSHASACDEDAAFVLAGHTSLADRAAVGPDTQHSRHARHQSDGIGEPRSQMSGLEVPEDWEQLPSLPVSPPASPIHDEQYSAAGERPLDVQETPSQPESPVETQHSTAGKMPSNVQETPSQFVEDMQQLPALPMSRPESPVETQHSTAGQMPSNVVETPSQVVEDMQQLPALPVSRPESPVETPLRPGPSIRPTSTTAIPIRFPFGHARSPTKDRSASFSSPLASTPVSPTSISKKPRPSSTEFRPLYLVERNRKPQEVEDTLPSLPSSKPSSRASSVHSSEDWHSAAEDPSSPETAKRMMIDVDSANSYNYDEEYLGSGQTTPKASEFPTANSERTARQAPQFYTWEDFERDERLHNDDVGSSGQIVTQNADDGQFDRLRSEVDGLPLLPDSRPGSPYESHAKPEPKAGRSAKAVAAAAMFGGAALIGHNALKSRGQFDAADGRGDEREQSEGRYPLPKPSAKAEASENITENAHEEQSTASRKRSKKGKKKSATQSFLAASEDTFAQTDATPTRALDQAVNPDSERQPTDGDPEPVAASDRAIVDDAFRDQEAPQLEAAPIVPLQHVETDSFFDTERSAEEGAFYEPTQSTEHTEIHNAPLTQETRQTETEQPEAQDQPTSTEPIPTNDFIAAERRAEDGVVDEDLAMIAAEVQHAEEDRSLERDSAIHRDALTEPDDAVTAVKLQEPPSESDSATVIEPAEAILPQSLREDNVTRTEDPQITEDVSSSTPEQSFSSRLFGVFRNPFGGAAKDVASSRVPRQNLKEPPGAQMTHSTDIDTSAERHPVGTDVVLEQSSEMAIPTSQPPAEKHLAVQLTDDSAPELTQYPETQPEEAAPEAVDSSSMRKKLKKDKKKKREAWFDDAAIDEEPKPSTPRFDEPDPVEATLPSGGEPDLVGVLPEEIALPDNGDEDLVVALPEDIALLDNRDEALVASDIALPGLEDTTELEDDTSVLGRPYLSGQVAGEIVLEPENSITDIAPALASPVIAAKPEVDEDVTRQLEPQTQETSEAAHVNTHRVETDRSVEQPEESTWQPLSKKSKKAKKGKKSGVYDSEPIVPLEEEVASTESAQPPATPEHINMPNTPDEQSDMLWEPPLKKRGKKGKMSATLDPEASTPVEEETILADDTPLPVSLEAVQVPELSAEVPETFWEPMPKKKGKKDKRVAESALLEPEPTVSFEEETVVAEPSQPSASREDSISTEAPVGESEISWEPMPKKKGKKGKKGDLRDDEAITPREEVATAPEPIQIPALLEENHAPDALTDETSWEPMSKKKSKKDKKGSKSALLASEPVTSFEAEAIANEPQELSVSHEDNNLLENPADEPDTSWEPMSKKKGKKDKKDNKLTSLDVASVIPREEEAAFAVEPAQDSASHAEVDVRETPLEDAETLWEPKSKKKSKKSKNSTLQDLAPTTPPEEHVSEPAELPISLVEASVHETPIEEPEPVWEPPSKKKGKKGKKAAQPFDSTPIPEPPSASEGDVKETEMPVVDDDADAVPPLGLQQRDDEVDVAKEINTESAFIKKKSKKSKKAHQVLSWDDDASKETSEEPSKTDDRDLDVSEAVNDAINTTDEPFSGVGIRLSNPEPALAEDVSRDVDLETVPEVWEPTPKKSKKGKKAKRVNFFDAEDSSEIPVGSDKLDDAAIDRSTVEKVDPMRTDIEPAVPVEDNQAAASIALEYPSSTPEANQHETEDVLKSQGLTSQHDENTHEDCVDEDLPASAPSTPSKDEHSEEASPGLSGPSLLDVSNEIPTVGAGAFETREPDIHTDVALEQHNSQTASHAAFEPSVVDDEPESIAKLSFVPSEDITATDLPDAAEPDWSNEFGGKKKKKKKKKGKRGAVDVESEPLDPTFIPEPHEMSTDPAAEANGVDNDGTGDIEADWKGSKNSKKQKKKGKKVGQGDSFDAPVTYSDTASSERDAAAVVSETMNALAESPPPASAAQQGAVGLESQLDRHDAPFIRHIEGDESSPTPVLDEDESTLARTASPLQGPAAELASDLLPLSPASNSIFTTPIDDFASDVYPDATNSDTRSTAPMQPEASTPTAEEFTSAVEEAQFSAPWSNEVGCMVSEELPPLPQSPVVTSMDETIHEPARDDDMLLRTVNPDIKPEPIEVAPVVEEQHWPSNAEVDDPAQNTSQHSEEAISLPTVYAAGEPSVLFPAGVDDAAGEESMPYESYSKPAKKGKKKGKKAAFFAADDWTEDPATEDSSPAGDNNTASRAAVGLAAGAAALATAALLVPDEPAPESPLPSTKRSKKDKRKSKASSWAALDDDDVPTASAPNSVVVDDEPTSISADMQRQEVTGVEPDISDTQWPTSPGGEALDRVQDAQPENRNEHIAEEEAPNFTTKPSKKDKRRAKAEASQAWEHESTQDTNMGDETEVNSLLEVASYEPHPMHGASDNLTTRSEEPRELAGDPGHTSNTNFGQEQSPLTETDWYTPVTPGSTTPMHDVREEPLKTAFAQPDSDYHSPMIPEGDAELAQHVQGEREALTYATNQETTVLQNEEPSVDEGEAWPATFSTKRSKKDKRKAKATAAEPTDISQEDSYENFHQDQPENASDGLRPVTEEYGEVLESAVEVPFPQAVPIDDTTPPVQEEWPTAISTKRSKKDKRKNRALDHDGPEDAADDFTVNTTFPDERERLPDLSMTDSTRETGSTDSPLPATQEEWPSNVSTKRSKKDKRKNKLSEMDTTETESASILPIDRSLKQSENAADVKTPTTAADQDPLHATIDEPTSKFDQRTEIVDSEQHVLAADIPMPTVEEDWPAAYTTKRSKKDKRKGESSGTATPVIAEQPLPVTSAYDDAITSRDISASNDMRGPSPATEDPSANSWPAPAAYTDETEGQHPGKPSAETDVDWPASVTTKRSKKDKRKGKNSGFASPAPAEERILAATADVEFALAHDDHDDVPMQSSDHEAMVVDASPSLADAFAEEVTQSQPEHLAEEQDVEWPASISTKRSNEDKRKGKTSNTLSPSMSREAIPAHTEPLAEVEPAIEPVQPSIQPDVPLVDSEAVEASLSAVTEQPAVLVEEDWPTSSKRSKKDKKRAKKSDHFVTPVEPTEPATEHVDDEDGLRSAPDQPDEVSRTLAAEESTSHATPDLDDSQPSPVTGEEWPTLSSKRSKKDKRKAQSAFLSQTTDDAEKEATDVQPGFGPARSVNVEDEAMEGYLPQYDAPIENDDSPTASMDRPTYESYSPEVSDRPDHQDANALVAVPHVAQEHASSETLHGRPQSTQQHILEDGHPAVFERQIVEESPVSRSVGPDVNSERVPDIDFAATLAAGLADSGFDPDLVVNDATFHRRASPPATQPEADPEEVFTTTSKRKKKVKQAKRLEAQDWTPEPRSEQATEESFTENNESRMPDQPQEGFDSDVAHSLQQSGFDPLLLQQAISSHGATSNDVTEDDTGISFSTSRRAKKGKKGKAAARGETLTLDTGVGPDEDTSATHEAPSLENERQLGTHHDLVQQDSVDSATIPPVFNNDITPTHEAPLQHPAENATEPRVGDPAVPASAADGTVIDPAHTFNVAGDRELDMDEMDKAYSAFKKKDRRKKKKQKAMEDVVERAPTPPFMTPLQESMPGPNNAPTFEAVPDHAAIGSRDLPASQDFDVPETERRFATRSSPDDTSSKVHNLFPSLARVKRRAPSVTSPTEQPHDASMGGRSDLLHTSEVSQSLPEPPGQKPSPTGEGPSLPDDMISDDRHDERVTERAIAPPWSFAALDSPRALPESPVLPTKQHEIARDSGYQEMSTPPLNRQSVESAGSTSHGIHTSVSRESLRSRRSAEPLHIATDAGPDWDLSVPKQRPSDETPISTAEHSRTPSREIAATPLESTTKNRASYLFQSPPANLRAKPDTLYSPSQERRSESDYFTQINAKPQATPTRSASSSGPHGHPPVSSPSNGPLSPRTLDVIPEEHGAAKRSKDDADVGVPAMVKAIRRTETPQAIRTSKEQALSPFRPTVTIPANDSRSRSNPLSTDDLINRLSWPAVDDDNSTVNINRSLKRGTPRPTLPEARSPSVVSNASNASVGQRLMSPNDLRSFSRSSNRSSTPTLRRIDRSLSGDLRAASRRGDTGSSVGARSSPKTIPFEAPPTPPSNNEDVIIAGAAGAAVMADVFVSDVSRLHATAADSPMQQGYGDARGSQVSPTRPPSVRKRQSMHITDLETKLDQLVAENEALQDAKHNVERNHEATSYQQDVNSQAMREALETRDLQLHEKEVEIGRIQAMLQPLREEIDRLNELNGGLTEANRNLVDDTNWRYATLQAEHAQAHEQWQSTSRELDLSRQEHGQLTSTMRDAIAAQIASALADKNTEIRRLREELEIASEQIRSLQVQIQSSKSNEFLTVRDEDYFDGACQKLCQHVQQWVLRFSKLSDNRICRLSTDLRDDKIENRLDNAILDGSDVDKLLGDRIKRRDVFMSVVMTMVWEFVFTRYLFGMDREQRQKLKALEKILAEVGPPRAIAQWRATTLTLLSKRPDFARQCALDTEAVGHEVFELLKALLPPPSNAESQLLSSLQKVIGVAADLAIEMRTQRSEYIMLPPLQPEYDTNGDLVRKVHFNASLMNERSGLFSSNESLEQDRAVVKIVLFPLVVKKGDEYGQGEEEIVVCPAQVLVHNDGGKGKKVVRMVSGAMEIDDPRRSRQSVVSTAPGSTAF
ncbi:hypothetical protein LTR17_002470 [Elasticomyces elasticus]|nr:hypothetical protein LTR17_002470 [Elasticomyces elasticus]